MLVNSTTEERITFDGITMPESSASEKALAKKSVPRSRGLWTRAAKGFFSAQDAARTSSGDKNTAAKITQRTRRFEARPLWKASAKSRQAAAAQAIM